MVSRKILKITTYTHYKSLSELMVRFVLIFAVLIWFNFGIDSIIGVGIVFSIDAIFVLYLHFEYWIRNYGEEYEILFDEIVQKKNGIEYRYTNIEIEKIIIFLSPTYYKNSKATLFSMDSYYYAEVVLKTGDKIILTSLLSRNLKDDLKQIKGVLFESKKRQFCNINKWW